MTLYGNDAMDSEQSSSRRYLLIGTGLLAVVAIVLVGARFLDDRFRSSVDVRPNPTPTVAFSVISSPTTGSSAAVSTPSPTRRRQVDGSPTGTASAEQAVERAYLRYWDAYSDALYSLDTTRLDEVMAGTELRLAVERVAELRSKNQAAVIDIEHNYVIVDVGSTTASIEDRYLNKSYLVDAMTKQPLQSPGTGEIEAIACRLELMDGTWKVVEVVRVSR